MNDGGQGTRNRDIDVSERVVQEIADALSVDPLDLEPMYDHVDLDALNTLFRTTAQSGESISVDFTAEGYAVTVSGPKPVQVEVTLLDDQRNAESVDVSKINVPEESPNVD
jgi:hypothetical protein